MKELMQLKLGTCGTAANNCCLFQNPFVIHQHTEMFPDCFIDFCVDVVWKVQNQYVTKTVSICQIIIYSNLDLVIDRRTVQVSIILPFIYFFITKFK